MNAHEILAMIRSSSRLPRESHTGKTFFYLLAFYAPRARLATGEPLKDANDFGAWLREVGDAIARDKDSLSSCPQGANVLPMHTFGEHREARCPRCSHVHQGAIACGQDLGGGRICRCELPVPA